MWICYIHGKNEDVVKDPEMRDYPELSGWVLSNCLYEGKMEVRASIKEGNHGNRKSETMVARGYLASSG